MVKLAAQRSRSKRGSEAYVRSTSSV